MKIRSIWLPALFAFSSLLFGQGDPNALAAYLDELRQMDSAQRKAVYDSTEFQRNVAHHREIEETVFKPLLTGDLGLYVAILKAGMNDSDPYIRSYSASLIAFIALNPEVSLMPNSPRVRVLETLVPSLVALTDENESEDVRVIALGSLARIISTGDSTIPIAFKKAVTDNSARVRGAGLLGLAWVPQEQPAVLDNSLRFLRSDPDAVNRKLAVSVLAEFPADDTRILPSLIASIDDPNVDVQRLAVSALHKRGHGNREVLQVLEKKLAQPGLDPSVRAQIERDTEVTKR